MTRPRVAIAGADGFIGSALCAALAQDHRVFALTRSPTWARMPPDRAGVVRRVCDLFSLDAVRTGLDGIDYAVYLAHSQAPSSRLTQARPADMDLVMADNFAQAAAESGVKQIVFVGGLIPEGFHISPLLWSRREVEMVLASRGTPVTALRAGLVVGAGGSAVGFLVDLVRRLPLIPLPGAAQSVTRPIALADLIRAIRQCLGRPEIYRGSFDLGGPDCLSYEQMARETAAILGLRRVIIRIPFIPLGLAAWAARLVSGAPASLIGPVIESLPQDTRMRDNPLQQIVGVASIPFCQALAAALDARRRRLPSPRQPTRRRDRILLRRASLVRSIQRIILPPGQDAAWVAGNYFRWLERGGVWPLICSHCDQDGSWTLCLRWPRLRLLTLRHAAAQSSRQRQVYRVGGGLLCRTDAPGQARFEFQTLLGDRYTMAAIHDYAPALPWYLYRWTQAPFHRWVMRRYQRHLARLAR
ncbi:NAD(P)H-binding protein [Thioalkalicoccus limnaeus]|uniref:NAD(P)H-binding protein n=1 Tax=Thioalkalicoccus limnaeus TaxID=120681 RepID=A0ABV4BDP5_9GAMM